MLLLLSLRVRVLTIQGGMKGEVHIFDRLLELVVKTVSKAAYAKASPIIHRAQYPTMLVRVLLPLNLGLNLYPRNAVMVSCRHFCPIGTISLLIPVRNAYVYFCGRDYIRYIIKYSSFRTEIILSPS